MKILLLTCLIAVSVALNCTNPLLKKKHNQLRPKNILKESIIAPDSLPVCKPLEGKDVCCGKDSWDDLKKKYNNVKDRFKKWVEKRTKRIKDLKDKFELESIDQDVSQLIDN